MDMDFGSLLGAFGMDEESMQKMMENPMVQGMIGKMNGLLAQGGIMPDDVEGLFAGLGDPADGADGEAPGSTADLAEMLDSVGRMFGVEYEEIDLDEEIAAYDPQPEDAADRAFTAALKDWIAAAAAEIPDKDVCALQIAYHLGFDADDVPAGEIWLAYNTAQTDAQNHENGAESWNFCNWTDECFRTMDAAPFEQWRSAQGYDLEEDDDDLTQRVYDLAAAAVMALHEAHLTEQCFGRRIPVIIEGYEAAQKTAIRAAKANGRDTLPKDFYEFCGFEDDE